LYYYKNDFKIWKLYKKDDLKFENNYSFFEKKNFKKRQNLAILLSKKQEEYIY
jgi:hypothetical protein